MIPRCIACGTIFAIMSGSSTIHASGAAALHVMSNVIVDEAVEITPPVREGTPLRHVRADVWRSASQPEAAVSASPRRLIVYNPGFGGARGNNTAGLAALTRRGYVVVAIDDIMRDGAYQDPADEIARRTDYDLGSDELAQKFVQAADQRVGLQAAKILATIDGLQDGYRTADGHRYRPALDLQRVGILGGSFGGAAAAVAAHMDRRIAAIVNLDGWTFGPLADKIVEVPFLILDSEESRFTRSAMDSPKSWRRHGALLNAREHRRQARQAAARNDTYRYLLTGAVHADFTDEVTTWSRWRSRFLSRHGPSITAARVRIVIDEVVTAFFDTALTRSDPQLMRQILSRYSELRDLGSTETP